MLNHDRVNQLSGICLDEQIPLAWVDNHVLISQDMSMAVGLKIEYPDTLFVSSVQIDELHNEFTSMLNQLALLDDTETRLQFITICHNQYGQMIDDYMMEMPRENQLLSQFKRDLGQHYVEKLQAGELRKYSTYLFIGIEPIVEFSERIKRVRKNERRASWMDGVSTFIKDTLELSMEDAARITEEEWNTAINILSKYVQQTTSILKAAGIQARAHAIGRVDRDPLLVVQSQVLH